MVVHMQTQTGMHAHAQANNCVGICPVYISELSLENSPVILVALMALHAQNMILYKDTLCVRSF
jgi:hypothetical protein